MNISLPRELEDLVAEKVATGAYESTNEVIRDALELLRDRETLREYSTDELRRELAIGVEQANRGELIPLDVAAIKVQARRLLGEKAE